MVKNKSEKMIENKVKQEIGDTILGDKSDNKYNLPVFSYVYSINDKSMISFKVNTIEDLYNYMDNIKNRFETINSKKENENFIESLDDDKELLEEEIEEFDEEEEIKEMPKTKVENVNKQTIVCGNCGSKNVYDNSSTKRNPKAPDYKCSKCSYVAWKNGNGVSKFVKPLPKI